MSKITFIYAYENEEWSTPMALVNEFKSRGWKTKIISIGSNRTGRYHDRELESWVKSDEQSDIVMFMDFGRFDSKWLDKSLKPNTFWVQESGDDPQNFERNFPKANRFHMTLTPDKDSCNEYVKRGIDAYWWTHFADTRVQFPITDAAFEYVAVTTRGKGGSEFLDTITEHSDGSFGNKNNMGAIEHTEFLNKGMMVLQNSRWGEITRRIFEGMACNRMVLTDRLNESKGLHELFIDGEDIVYYDDMVDCINKVNDIFNNPTERIKIANSGYEKVLKYHTQIQRVDFIIEKWKEHVQGIKKI